MGFGGGTPGDMGGGQGGYGPDTGAGLDAFGGAGASIDDITSNLTTVAGEMIGGNDDSGNGGNSETTQQMRERIQAQQAAQSQQASDRAQSAINQAIRERLSDPLLPQNVSRGFGQGSTPISQLFARQYNQPLPNIGFLGVTLNSLAGRVPQGIADRLGKGGTPVYDGTGQIVGVMGEGLFGGQAYYGRPGFDPNQVSMEKVEDAAGNVIGYKTDSLTGTFGDDDGGESTLRVSLQPQRSHRPLLRLLELLQSIFTQRAGFSRRLAGIIAGGFWILTRGACWTLQHGMKHLDVAWPRTRVCTVCHMIYQGTHC